MISHRIKASLLALALCWGLTAVAQDTAPEAGPTAEAAQAVEAADDAAPAATATADTAPRSRRSRRR